MQSIFTLNIPPPTVFPPQTPLTMQCQYKHKSSHNPIPYQPIPQLTPKISKSPQPNLSRPDSEARPSKFVKNYAIDYNQHIGNGNFSHVYVAIDQKQPNTKLAVKVVNAQLLRQQKLQNLIKSEVDVLLSLRHQNILVCKDVFWDNTFCYIFTQFCENGSLEQKIKSSQKNSPFCSNSQQGFVNEFGVLKTQPQSINKSSFLPNLTQKQMLPLIKDVFQAMIYLEKQHIVHRDIKAANIFLKENKAIVADFGFARHVYEPFTDLNIGSLPFMPPESIIKNIYSNKTDVWAFGILLFEIFHGESPFAKSKDVKELAQKVYIPLSVACIRKDLSTELKQLLLSCLQADMEKRKKFSELAQMWFCKKLFNNNNVYRQHGNSHNVGRVGNEVPRISFNGGDVTKVGKNQNEHILGVDSCEHGYGIRLLNQKSFRQSQKDIINVGNSSIKFNQNISVHQPRGREKQSKVAPLTLSISIPNTPPSSFSNRSNNEQETGRIQYPINELTPQNYLKKECVNKSSNLAPTSIQFVHCTNPINISPSKVNSKTVKLDDLNNSKTPLNVPQINIKIRPTLGSPNNQNAYQRQANESAILNSLIKPQNHFQSKITEAKFELLPNKQEKIEISFKEALIKIQEIRNYYKLSLLLKDRNKKMSEIKSKFLMRSVKEMMKIQNLILDDQIDLSTYDKVKKDVIQQNDQKATNIKNRKIKLLSIIKDYMSEFESQIKRRDLLFQSEKKGYKDGIDDDLETLQSPSFCSSSTEEERTNSQLANLELNSYQLSQDIQYVIQSQLIHPQNEITNQGEQLDGLQYRKKIKQMIDEIMAIGNVFPCKTNVLTKDFSKSKSQLNQNMNIQNVNLDDLSTMGLKPKYNCN